MILQDDGSRVRMPDIRIDYRDQLPAYVEVWTDMDRQYAAMYSRLMKPENQLPLELIDPALSRVWWVTVSGAAIVDGLQWEIGEILERLERAGVTFEQVGELTSSQNPDVIWLRQRGVVRVSSRACKPGEPGTIRFLPAGISGPPEISWQRVAEWLNQTLSSERLDDVRSKLVATGAAERHLFLGVTYSSSSDAFFALDEYDQSLPDEPPNLPHEITHLWLMHAISVGRCIAWFPERGWFEPSGHWATP